jgi:hypothetical protein
MRNIKGFIKTLRNDPLFQSLWFYEMTPFWASASQDYEDAKENKGMLSERMTREQIAEAQKLSREWLAKRSK